MRPTRTENLVKSYTSFNLKEKKNINSIFRWEEGPLTEVNSLVTIDELKTLKSRGVKGVIADWPLDTYEGLEKSPNFKQLLQNIKDVGIDVIVDLEPGTSSIFFSDSEAKSDAYVNYYIWQNNAKGNSTDPPNNWVILINLIP